MSENTAADGHEKSAAATPSSTARAVALRHDRVPDRVLDRVPDRDPHRDQNRALQSGRSAPTVVAKGYGLIAEEIIARAREHGVALHQSRELVSLLMQVDLDREIPPALYQAIAELLAWLHHLDDAMPAMRGERGKQGERRG